MYHVIINPASSSGKGMETWDRIKTILDEKSVAYEAHVLDAPGEATELTRSLTLKSDTRLLVVGGDGTLNEVLNGIEDFEHTTLSCVQNGSGNDFARNMNLEKNIEKAIAHLLEQPEEIKLDYGEVIIDDKGPKRFLISCGVGYDADICEEVSRSRLKKILNRLHLGKLVYVIIGVKQIFTKKTIRAKLYLDDGEMIKLPKLFFAVGMNHMYEGGGVPFCPAANPTDGYMDVCVVKGMSKWKLLLAVVMVYFKKHLLFKDISNYRCKKMRLVTEEPQWIHMDGEATHQVKQVVWESKRHLRFVR
ncbi:MAG: diacylglycerol/lipid kinase family protein [Wujia sp.]